MVQLFDSLAGVWFVGYQGLPTRAGGCFPDLLSGLFAGNAGWFWRLENWGELG